MLNSGFAAPVEFKIGNVEYARFSCFRHKCSTPRLSAQRVKGNDGHVGVSGTARCHLNRGYNHHLAKLYTGCLVFGELSMRPVYILQLDLERIISRLPWQDLDVAIVDELQHGTEQATDFCLAGLFCQCLKSTGHNLQQTS